MFSIDQTIPSFRTLTFMQGALALFDFASYRGRWLVLCGIPSMGLPEVAFLDHAVEAFAQEGATLLGLARHNAAVHAAWYAQVPTCRVPLLVDPSGRIHRALAIAFAFEDTRCCTVVIDPNGVLKFRLVHALHGRGMEAPKEILMFLQQQASSHAQESRATIEAGTCQTLSD